MVRRTADIHHSVRTVAVMLVVMLASTSTWAGDDVAHLTWQELVQRASAAAARGEPREALAWAQKAAAIHLPPSLRVFMLGPQRAVGDSAAAYANAKLCVTEAESDANVPNRDKVLAACRDAVSALKPAIAELSVTLPSPLPADAKVMVNGSEVLPALLALPYPVNPGLVTLDVSAPGYTAFHREATAGASATVPMTATLVREPPRCADGETMAPDKQRCLPPCAGGNVRASDGTHCCGPGQTWASDTGACTGALVCPAGLVADQGHCVAPPPPPPPAPLPPPVEKKRGVAPLVVAGAGAALVAGGTIAWVVSSSKYSTLQNDCGGANQCLPARYSSDSSGIGTLDALGVLGWTLGGAALLGGGFWYLVSSSETSSGAVHVQVSPTGRGVSISGAF